MLFLSSRPRDTLQRALRAAVAAHRATFVRELLASHGEKALARALNDLSGRVIADTLSMLPEPERTQVLRHLRRAAYARYREAGGPTGGGLPSLDTRLSALSLLVWKRPV